MRQLLKIVAIVACISFFGSFQVFGDDFQGPAPTPTGDYRPEVSAGTVTIPGNGGLTGDERGTVTGAYESTIGDINSHAESNSDPIKEAENAVKLISEIQSTTSGVQGPNTKPVEAEQINEPGGPRRENEPPRGLGTGGGLRYERFKPTSKKLDSEIQDLFNFISERGSSVTETDSKEKDSGQEKSDPLTNFFDRQLEKKIENVVADVEKAVSGVENGVSEEPIVLDAIDFTREIKAIHGLLNPPARLHPWLKWLLYLHRVTPEMLELYQVALERRDNIYFLASKSDGKLKIRYQGKIMDVPIFIWLDQAEGPYELVMVREGRTPVPYESSNAVPVTPTNPTP